MNAPTSPDPKPRIPKAWIVTPPDAPRVAIWGLPPEERLRRQLARVGIACAGELAPGERPTTTDGGSAAGVLLVRADHVLDERLLSGLAERPEALLLAPSGAAVAAHVGPERVAEALALVAGEAAPVGADASRGLARLAPSDLAPAWTPTLRKLEPPYLYGLRDAGEAERRAIERRLFAASYKGITDLVTKWVWPAPAEAVTRWLARRSVHPNVVTIASWLLAVGTLVLFARGAFGAGLVLAWLMTFLDTVDGKLARVTLTSSRVGHVLDHGLDLVHPPFWWLAWGLALPDRGLETAIVVGGYFVGRALEGIFLLAFGLEIHCWRPIDSLFRTITARRNPNLILLSVGTLGGRPDLGFALVALWTLVSYAFHGVRLAQAFRARRRGEPIAAWDEAPAPELRQTPRARASGAGPRTRPTGAGTGGREGGTP